MGPITMDLWTNQNLPCENLNKDRNWAEAHSLWEVGMGKSKNQDENSPLLI